MKGKSEALVEDSSTYFEAEHRNMDKQTIVVLVRGHIRESFKNKRFYDFLKELCDKYTVNLYIHTWNTYSSNLSWRKVEENNSKVSVLDIRTYFSGLNCIIQSIEIDDETKIDLIGDTNGYIFSTLLPKLAWKRMWYGINKMMEIISSTEDADIMVINTRFDLFNNSFSQNDNSILINFVGDNIGQPLTNIKFLNRSENLLGVDNYYIGPPNKIYKLVNNFHKNLDSINEKYKKIHFQEVTVFYENNFLFYIGETDEKKYENMSLYTDPINNNNNNGGGGVATNITDESLRNSTELQIDYFSNKNLNSNIDIGLCFVKNSDTTYIEHKKVNYFLNGQSVRDAPIIGVKHTSSDWKGFGKKR